jgi:hypothetical protein
MNNMYHGGRPVFTRMGGGVTINTSYMTPVHNQLPQNYVNQGVVGSYKQDSTAVAYTTTSYPSAGYGVPLAQPVGVQPHMVTAQPVNVQSQRVAYVSVPAGALPGQMLSCATPTGEILQVNLFFIFISLFLSFFLGSCPTRCCLWSTACSLLLTLYI